MKSNSNTNITNFTVDPITQQITSLEVNGESIELSPEPTPVGSDVEVYGLANGSSQPSWTNVTGIAFMSPDKTQGGYALMNGSGGWTKSTATWNDDFTKIVVSYFSYNYALIDSSFFG